MQTHIRFLVAFLFGQLLFAPLEGVGQKNARKGTKDTRQNLEWAAVADSLLEKTQITYGTSSGIYKQDNRGSDKFHYWWNAHALDVLVDAYERTKQPVYLHKMKALLTGIKHANGGKYQIEFNDDMQWLGIACVRAYQATNDKQYLDVANELWTEVKKGWTPVHGGGVMWRTDTPNEKNACSNGPAAILALKLYEVNKESSDLEWAKRIYEWQKRTLVDSATGLVWDNISLKNNKAVINKKVFTYNVGTYIGAATALYTFTKNKVYLADALQSAQSTMVSPLLTRSGVLRPEGQGDGGLFKGILIRYFTALALHPDVSSNDSRRFISFLKFNAETFRSSGIHRPAMLSSPDWQKATAAKTDLSTQLSGLMLLEAMAKVARR